MAEPMQSDIFSLSIFTFEADGRPGPRHRSQDRRASRAVCVDERVRAVLREASRCDDLSVLRVRLARKEERQLFYKKREIGSVIGGLHAVYL